MQLELKSPDAQNKRRLPMADDNAQEIALQVPSHDEQLDIATASALHQGKSLKLDSPDIDLKIEALFQAYGNEDFEDGMDSELISEITASIQTYGTQAIETIRRIVLEQNLQPQMAFEALRWLGRVSHPESYRSRLFLLETCLGSPSRLMRDGAALGLASMKDSHAIPYLREAVAREKIQDLRKDLETVLSRLEKLPDAAISIDDK